MGKTTMQGSPNLPENGPIDRKQRPGLLDLVELQGALSVSARKSGIHPSSPPGATATKPKPRLLPSLVTSPANVTNAQHSLGIIQNADSDTIHGMTREQTAIGVSVRTAGGASRTASLGLSRTGTHTSLHQRDKRQSDNQEGVKNVREREGQDAKVGDVSTDLPTFDKPHSLTKEFTFTGYDIMADVMCPPPGRAPEDTVKQSQLAFYRAMCLQMGVIPVSFIEHRLIGKAISIRNYGLGSNGAKALASTLAQNHHVRYLDISSNQLGPKGGKAIARMLMANSSIEELHIDENKIGLLGGTALCMAIREKEDFRKLSLASNGLKSDDGFYIADMLEHNIYLRELNLSHNQLEYDGAIVIGDSLVTNDTLEVLDLSWNCIRGPSAIAVAYGLSKNNGLRVLKLAWNGFGRKGCAALAQALSVNSTLNELDLRCNRVYMEDVAALMKGLENNTTLHTLRLAMNPITPHGAMLLLKKLEKMESSALLNIDLSDIVVSAEFVDLMERLQEMRLIRVRHGVTICHSQSPVQGEEDMGIYSTDPRALVFKLMENENLRVVDLFHRLDDDNNYSLTRSEFKAGITMVGLAITEDQLDRIVDIMDIDGDGSVDLGELLKSERQYKRCKLKRKKREERERKTSDNDLEIPVLSLRARLQYGAAYPVHTGASPGNSHSNRLKATALSTIASLGTMKMP